MRPIPLISCATRSDALNVRSTTTGKVAGAVALRAGLFGLLLLFVSPTWADPDLWGHVKFGGDIAATGLQATDPYSFASDRPWINHEWLAERLMYEAWARGGGPGLIAVKAMLALAALVFVLAAIRDVPMSPALCLLLLFTAAAGLWARVYVFRPQIFSLVLFAALLWIFRTAEKGRFRSLWLVPAAFGLWVNLHGGWIVGLAALALWSVLNLTSFRSATVPPWRLVGVLLTSVAATLANPYGPVIWQFLAETVRLERGMIADWQPLLSTGPGKIVAWGTAATLAGVALVHRRPPVPLAHVLLVTGLAAASLKVSRLDAFFSLSAVMLLAPQIAGFAEGRKARVAPNGTGPWWGWPVALVAGGALTALLFQRQFTCVRLDGPWMPEREAAAWIQHNRLRGRLLAWFDWGQYAIWHFAPELQVSLDGRRETVYSDAYLARHADLYYNPGGQRELLGELDADHAWLSKELPLVAALESDGWTRLFTGSKSVVLSRRAGEVTTPAPIRTPACFPGP